MEKVVLFPRARHPMCGVESEPRLIEAARLLRHAPVRGPGGARRVRDKAAARIHPWLVADPAPQEDLP